MQSEPSQLCYALWVIKAGDNSVVCCEILGLIIRDDKGNKERKEQTGRIYQAFNPVFHLTARNSSAIAHPGRCHSFSFNLKPSLMPIWPKVTGKMWAGIRLSTAEQNSQSWSSVSASPLVRSAPALCGMVYGEPNRDGAALPLDHGATSCSHSPPMSARCHWYARMCVSTRKRRCRGTILALPRFVSGYMQPYGSTGRDCRPQPVLDLHPCSDTLSVPVQLQNSLQDQDGGGALGVFPLGCY